MGIHAAEMAQLCERLYGHATSKSPREHRYGAKGSKVLRLDKDEWYDFETSEGGGYAQLYKKVHGDYPPKTNGNGSNGHGRHEHGRVESYYLYVDANGDPLFRVVRRTGHQFSQEVYDVHVQQFRSYKGCMAGVERVLYRLPQLSHVSADEFVFVVEGEKDCDRLHDEGLIATTNPGGAGKWHDALSKSLAGLHCIVVPDNDDPGRKHADEIIQSLQGHAVSIRRLDLPGLPPKGDVSDWLDAGGTADELRRLARGIPLAPPPHQLPVIALQWERLSDWAGKDVAPVDWIFPGWIPRGRVTGLYGPGGSNKTCWLIQLTMAVAAGLAFCGAELQPRPTMGLYIEDTRDVLLRRAGEVAAFYGLELGDFPDCHFTSLVGFDHPELATFDNGELKVQPMLTELDKRICEHKLQLVVLDTLPHFHSANEIERSAVSKFLRKLDSIALARDCAIVFSAHPSQRGRREQTFDSGSTAWEGGVRARISLTVPDDEDEEDNAKPRPPTNQRVLTLRKSNYSASGQQIDLLVERGVFTSTGSPRTYERIVRGPARDAELDQRFLKLLEQIELEGRWVNDSPNFPARFAPLVFSKHALGKGPSIREWQRAMERLFSAGAIRLAGVRLNGRAHQKIIVNKQTTAGL